MERVKSQAVVALQVIRARGAQALGSTQILIAPVVLELRAALQYLLLSIAHINVLRVLSVTQGVHSTSCHLRMWAVGSSQICLFYLSEEVE